MLLRKLQPKTMKQTSDYLPPHMTARLGPLEDELLRLLWTRGSATVRELIDTGKIEGAYTTIMTTLDRLHKKGLLNREPDGRAFRYAPAQTEQEFNGAIVQNAIQHMLGAVHHSSAPLSYLVEAITKHDRNLLDELERQIERKRKELNGDK
jgi:predicted transcriptional regulator